MSDIVFLSLYQCPQLVKGNKTTNSDLKALYTITVNPHTFECCCLFKPLRTAMNVSPTSGNGASHTHTHTTGYYEDYGARGSEAAPHVTSNKWRQLAVVTLIL